MMVATTASAIVSIYFMFNPPRILPTFRIPPIHLTKKARKKARKSLKRKLQCKI